MEKRVYSVILLPVLLVSQRSSFEHAAQTIEVWERADGLAVGINEVLTE